MLFEGEPEQRPDGWGPFQSVISVEEGIYSGEKGKCLQNLQGKAPLLFTKENCPWKWLNLNCYQIIIIIMIIIIAVVHYL